MVAVSVTIALLRFYYCSFACSQMYTTLISTSMITECSLSITERKPPEYNGSEISLEELSDRIVEW